MKKMYKLLLLFITLILTTQSFTGCKSKEASKGKNAEKPTLVWYLMGSKQADLPEVMEKVNAIAEKEIGAKVDIQLIDTNSYQEKMNMLVASNANYDLCFTADWVNKFIPNASKGAYLKLNDLLKTTPDLKNSLPEHVYNAATIDGNIYAVPNLQVLFFQTAVLVFKDYTDKYNFDVTKVKKIEDLEPLFKAIKENEPNIYPFRPNYGVKPFITPKYEIIEPTTGVVVSRDGNDKNTYLMTDTEEYKKGIEVLSNWYKKGYIRSDINSVVDDSTEVNGGKYASFMSTWKPGAEAENEKKFMRKVVFAKLEEPYLKANAGAAAMTAIGRNSKNSEKAIKLIELVNTNKEVYNLLINGIEGKHYTKISENKIKKNPDASYMVNGWEIGNVFNTYLNENQEDDIWERTSELNNSSIISPISGFVLNTDPIKNELSQIATVSKEFAALENGSENIQEVLPNFLRRSNMAGQDKIFAEVSNQLNTFRNK